MLKVILKTKGGKYKHQSQITSTEAGEAWKEEMEVCSISLFFARGVTCYGFILDGDKEREICRDLD